jgi:hypothetical protein
MGAASVESRKQREVQAMTLNKQKKRLEDHLDRMYLDKLEGIIGDEEYVRLSKKFRGELTDAKFRIEGLAEGKEVCIDNGKRLLELAQKAASLYSAQIPSEKRKLLNLVYSNSIWAGGELASNYRKPFDLIADSNQTYQREKATNPKKSDLFDIWRPLVDALRTF